MDIISGHGEVGIYRGAAVACGTESRCRSWSFLPLGAEARLSWPTEYSAESAVARHVKWLPRQGMERSLLRLVLIRL